MARIYFWANAAAYALLGLACMLNPERLARAVGYYTLDNSGSSDFLAVYGGLQLGLAAFFALAGSREELQRPALLFAVCLYAGLVALRLPSLALYHPVRTVTYVAAGAELLGLLFAGILLPRARRAEADR
jgi:hypothetical protein